MEVSEGSSNFFYDSLRKLILYECIGSELVD